MSLHCWLIFTFSFFHPVLWACQPINAGYVVICWHLQVNLFVTTCVFLMPGRMLSLHPGCSVFMHSGKAMHSGKFSHMKILSLLMIACDMSDLPLFVHAMIYSYKNIECKEFSQLDGMRKNPTPPAVDLCEWHVDDLSHTFTAMFTMD